MNKHYPAQFKAEVARLVLYGGWVVGADVAAPDLRARARPGPAALGTRVRAAGTIDQPNIVFLARSAQRTSTALDVNEAERIGWIPLIEIQERIQAGEIVGAGSVAGLLAVLLAQATNRL